MNIRVLSAILLIAVLLTPSFSGCKDGKLNDTPKHTRTFYGFFDTVSTVSSYANDKPETFTGNAEAVLSLLGEYHKLFDIYYEYSGVNNLKTVNDNAGKAPVKVDKRIIDFLVYAKEVCALTGGATNVAMGSVLSLWHTERQKANDYPESARLPTTENLTNAAKHTDIDNLIIDKENGTVFLADPDMSLDVGALGKGYATEKAAEMLVSRGVSSYVINVGGNVRVIGEKASGEGWVTGITNPDKTDSEDFICKVNIKDTSIVTSGDYERYYTVGGVKYHHIIDPRTNMPAQYFSSVSVLTQDSGLADALSTALFCMSYEEGKTLVATLGGIEVIWITKKGEIFFSDGVNFYNG